MLGACQMRLPGSAIKMGDIGREGAGQSLEPSWAWQDDPHWSWRTFRSLVYHGCMRWLGTGWRS
jgi:hypothetical protein